MCSPRKILDFILSEMVFDALLKQKKSLPMPNQNNILKITYCKRNLFKTISKRSHGGSDLCASYNSQVSSLLDLLNLETV